MKKFAFFLAALILLLAGCSALPFSLDECKIESITIGDSTSLSNEEIKEFAELLTAQRDTETT